MKNKKSINSMLIQKKEKKKRKKKERSLCFIFTTMKQDKRKKN